MNEYLTSKESLLSKVPEDIREEWMVLDKEIEMVYKKLKDNNIDPKDIPHYAEKHMELANRQSELANSVSSKLTEKNNWFSLSYSKKLIVVFSLIIIAAVFFEIS